VKKVLDALFPFVFSIEDRFEYPLFLFGIAYFSMYYHIIFYCISIKDYKLYAHVFSYGGVAWSGDGVGFLISWGK